MSDAIRQRHPRLQANTLAKPFADHRAAGTYPPAASGASAVPASESGRRAWKALFDLAIAIHSRLPCIAADLGLSVPQCHVLRLLRPEQPQIMGSLARSLGCDASNVTGIVDRLESLGLIERRFAPSDRRVRELALTERGVSARVALLARLYDPPAPLLALPEDRQRELCRILEEAFGGIASPGE